jgi:hypothetical protein
LTLRQSPKVIGIRLSEIDDFEVEIPRVSLPTDFHGVPHRSGRDNG